MSVAAIVLTKNEQDRVAECLKRLKPYVDYILVVDNSTDRTIDFAKPYADKILVKLFSGDFGEERNHAHEHVPFWHEWVLHVDCDEIFPEDFLKQMKQIIAENSDVDSFRFPRFSLTTPEEVEALKNSGRLSTSPHGICKDYPDFQVRLMKKNAVVWKGKTHEVPYSIVEDKPIDQVSCLTFGEVPTYPKYTIIHLPRRHTIIQQKREWW